MLAVRPYLIDRQRPTHRPNRSFALPPYTDFFNFWQTCCVSSAQIPGDCPHCLAVALPVGNGYPAPLHALPKVIPEETPRRVALGK